MDNNFISVAMAVYNGEKYINEQIQSILCQLSDNDELIISINDSTDNTLKVLNELYSNDKRIKIYFCEEKGVISNFENAISKCNGKYIFLSDQDDIWQENKVIEMMRYLTKADNILVLHNTEIVDSNLNLLNKSLFLEAKAKRGVFKNIIKNSYQGCCMAFNASLKKYILPIPRNIAMHDQWIGIIAEIYGTVYLLDEKLILYRRHEDNVTTGRINVIKKIYYIFILVSSLIKRFFAYYMREVKK
ncbi:MAG: glycosyltransferase family 2 protein [Erysipelotrichaceae bacterium]|nr:glycosyltransferase family 2 protein [Erysipelotrichaceae bacterium]